MTAEVCIQKAGHKGVKVGGHTQSREEGSEDASSNNTWIFCPLKLWESRILSFQPLDLFYIRASFAKERDMDESG